MGQRIIISEEERKDIQSLYEEFDAKDGYVIHQNTKFSVEHPKLGELCINNSLTHFKRLLFCHQEH